MPAVFFVAFLPQFLDTSRPIAPQVAALGVVYVLVAIAVDTYYVLATSAIARRLAGNAVAQRRTARMAAATYVALGLAAAAAGGRK